MYQRIGQIAVLINPFLVLNQDDKFGARINLFARCQVIQPSFDVHILWAMITVK